MLSNCNCARRNKRGKKSLRENVQQGMNFGNAMPTFDRNTQHARDNNGNMKSFGQIHTQTMVLTAKTPFYHSFFTFSLFSPDFCNFTEFFFFHLVIGAAR